MKKKEKKVKFFLFFFFFRLIIIFDFLMPALAQKFNSSFDEISFKYSYEKDVEKLSDTIKKIRSLTVRVFLI